MSKGPSGLPPSKFDDGSTPTKLRTQAAWAVSLAHALLEVGWFAHQHAVDVFKCEKESTPFEGHIPHDISSRMSTLSARLSQAVALLPQPTLRSYDSSAVPSSQKGVRLPLPNTPFPLERTLSRSTESTSPLLWKAIVLEVASGWASFMEPLALGLLFLGPKERLCYWPRWLNRILLDIPVSYGQVWDLFMVLAMFGMKLDLKSAFRSVAIDPEDAALLGAVLDSFPITFTRLPFGLKSSPVIFVALLARTLATFRSSMPSTTSAMSSFVDDISSGATSLQDFVASAESLVSALLHDGWWIALSKTFLFPAVRLCYIGFLIDFQASAVRITPSKHQKFLNLLCSIPLPARDSLPQGSPSNSATSRSLRIAASSTGFSVLQTDLLSPPPTFPRTPCFAGSASVALPSTWPSHSLFHTLDDLLSALSDPGTVLPSTSRSPPPFLSIVCLPDAIPEVMSSLPPPLVARAAVILISVAPSRKASGSSWLERALSDLSPAAASRLLAKLPAISPNPLPPQPTCSSPSLTPESWATLKKLMGTLAWFQSVFRWLGYFREPLDRTLQSSDWSISSCDAIFMLRDIFSRFGNVAASARRPSNPLTIVVDSAKAWGAVVPSNSSPPIFCAGPIPLEVLGSSSTVKETWGARRATCRAMEFPQSSFDGVDVTVDSTALVGAADSGSSVATINEALWFFAILVMAGFPVLWSWERRSSALHPLADALSATPQPWPLRGDVHSTVETSFGRATFCVGSCAPPYMGLSFRYATLRCGNAERDSILEGINPQGHAGWIGPVSDRLPIAQGETAFCHVLWSQLPDLWATWSPSQRFSIILIAPTHPSLWWGPALARFQEIAVSSLALPPTSLAPPVQNRSTTAPDPRPMSAYLIPSRDARTACSRGGSTAYAASVPNALNPGPRRDPWEGSAAQIPQPPNPCTAIPLTASATTIAIPLFQSPSIPPASAPPTQPSSLPTPPRVRTLGSWVEEVLRYLATGAEVNEAVHPRIVEAATALSVPPRSSSNRPGKAVEYLSTLIADVRIGDIPFSLPNLQATVKLFVNRRLEPKPPFGWSVVTNAATVASDCSAIAAASSRAGIPVPPHCGTLVRALLEENKAFTKKDHSSAFPLPLDALLRAEPPKRQADRHMAWSALVLMSVLCLRSGVLFHITRAMIVPYAGGWLMIWRHSHKRAGSAANDPLFTTPSVMVAAARHPVLTRIIESSGSELLFPGLTSAMMTSFITSCIPGVHPAFDIRTYGARVAAAQDAITLLVPGPLMRALFWWRQMEAPMAEYYAGANVLLMFLFCEARCRIQHTPLTPGYFAASLSTAPPDWSRAIVGAPPPLPSASQAACLQAAWFATSPSYIAKRVQLASYVIRRASKVLDRILNCAGCKALLGPHDTAYLCDHSSCRWGLCPTCHPSGLDGSLLCPSHSTD